MRTPPETQDDLTQALYTNKLCYEGDVTASQLNTINERIYGGLALLHIAAMKNENQMLCNLIKNGANPYLRDNEQRTPLWIAAFFGATSCLDSLLEYTKDASEEEKAEHINSRGPNGWTALHAATRYDQHECLSILMMHGADPLQITTKQETVTELALLHNASNCVNKLLPPSQPQSQCTQSQPRHTPDNARQAADRSELCDQGTAASSQLNTMNAPHHPGAAFIIAAIKHENIRSLCELRDVDPTPHLPDYEQLRAPLWLAAYYGARTCIDSLLEFTTYYSQERNDEYINAYDPNGLTALHAAVLTDQHECLARLIHYGADPLKLTLSNETVMGLAVRYNAYNCVNTLITTYQQQDQHTLYKLLHTPNDKGESILHMAATYNYTRLIIPLINAGANVTQLDTQGKSALWLAAYHGDTPSLEALLKATQHPTHIKNAGIINSPGLNGLTALHVTTFTDQHECLARLIQYGADPLKLTAKKETVMGLAVLYNAYNCVNTLITLYQQIDRNTLLKLLHTPNDKGESVLHVAATYNYAALICPLINFGANVGQLNAQGKSALWIAASLGNADALRALTDSYTKLNNLSIKYELSVDQPRFNGYTPLLIAVMQQYSDCAYLLIMDNANAKVLSPDGFSVIYYAIQYRNIVLLESILSLFLYKSIYCVYLPNNNDIRLAIEPGNILFKNRLIQYCTELYQSPRLEDSWKGEKELIQNYCKKSHAWLSTGTENTLPELGPAYKKTSYPTVIHSFASEISSSTTSSQYTRRRTNDWTPPPDEPTQQTHSPHTYSPHTYSPQEAYVPSSARP